MDTKELRSKRTCPVCGRTYTEPPAISRRSKGIEICPECGTREAIEDWNWDQEERTETHTCDSIGRQVAIDAVDAIGHIATMPDGDKCIRRSAVKYTLSMLPPAQPEYEPVTAEDFAKTMSETSVYSYMVWHSEALTLMERQGFVICKKTM